MRALLSGVIATIEAVAVALATLLGVAVFTLLVWWLSFDLVADPLAVLSAAASIWLLGHFIPMRIDVSPEAMQSLGFAPETLSFALTLAPLGITLVTVLLAIRSGWRFALRGGSGIAGVFGGTLGFGAVVGVGTVVAGASTLPWGTAAVIGASIYGLSSLAAYLTRAASAHQEWWEKLWHQANAHLGRVALPGSLRLTSNAVRRYLGAILRLAIKLVAGLIALAAVSTAVTFVAGYANITAATQALQLDPWGAIMLFVLQLLLLPVMIIWAASWLIGTGFSIGLGTSVSPFGALLGPLPALPVFAGIPDGWGSVAVLAPFLVGLTGLIAGALYGRGSLQSNTGPLAAFLTVVAAATLAGLIVAALLWSAAGSIGPGRLAHVGPDVWITAGFAALELGIGGLLGAFAGRADYARITATTQVILPGARGSGTTEPAFLSSDITEPVPSSHSLHNNVGIHDQLTEPLEPLPTDRSPGEGNSAAARADDALPVPISFPRDRHVNLLGESNVDPDFWASIEPDGEQPAYEEPETPQTPAREPELFDQAETMDLTGASEVMLTGDTARSDEITAEERDPLLEAFAWDAPHPEEQASRRRGWRLPRRKG